MPSTFTWLDHSDRERRRVLDAIDQFRESSTVDELGLGPLRDGFADLFFPGTSTIQTRARYFLFVPWTYQRMERTGAPDRFPARVRREEVHVRDALMETDDSDGVIGKVKGIATKRLASSIYWLGLSTWGIRRFPGAQADYDRAVERRNRRLRDVLRDDDGDPVDGATSLAWDPHLPPRPDDFPEKATFALVPGEAAYLMERIKLSRPDSLLAFLVQRGRTLDAESPWAHPELAEFPRPVRDALDHARLLSETMNGAALLYNVILSEEMQPGALRDERVSAYRAALNAWCHTLRQREHAIRAWDRDAFWTLGHRIANVRGPTRDFVETWLNLGTWRDPATAADSPAVRSLIRERELRLKGKARARIGNPRALESWRGEAGTAPLSYRWRSAVRILTDIHAGLEGSDA